MTFLMYSEVINCWLLFHIFICFILKLTEPPTPTPTPIPFSDKDPWGILLHPTSERRGIREVQLGWAPHQASLWQMATKQSQLFLIPWFRFWVPTGFCSRETRWESRSQSSLPLILSYGRCVCVIISEPKREQIWWKTSLKFASGVVVTHE